jgi:hypothetical protein
VRERIENTGAEVLYLNPIEKAWAKLKQPLRSNQARTKETLEQASALELITQTTPRHGSDAASTDYSKS